MVRVEIGPVWSVGLVPIAPTDLISGMASSSNPRKSVVTAKAISPGIPSDPQHRKELEDDLVFLSCHGLIERPWSVKSDEIIRELLTGVSNQFELTVRGRPITWSTDQ